MGNLSIPVKKEGGDYQSKPGKEAPSPEQKPDDQCAGKKQK
jgi:hypothetical protein